MAARETSEEFIARHSAALADVYDRGRATACRVAPETMAAALYRGACSLSEHASETVEHYLASVHAEDLALACALIAGDATAWDNFVARYRPILYASARAIARDELRARELADSLWAELYGIRGETGARRPLLIYFHGRSSLATWLHALLARRHIDALRAERRHSPIESVAPRDLAIDSDPPNPEQPRYLELMGRALNDALDTMKPRDRLRLAYHYSDGLTLKQIGALMEEREWTVSRRLKRTREGIRRRIERTLRAAGLGTEEIRQCYDYAMEGWSSELKPRDQRSGGDATKDGQFVQSVRK
jgi:RNA polymerase sigma-70 factor (ECF subfamily)